MQMPLLSYPQFSQFLQLQQQQQRLQERFSRSFPTAAQNTELGMLTSHRSGTSCSEASTGTPSPSPSPPLSFSDNFSSNNVQPSSGKTAKSFTIDAILGIRENEVEKINRDHLNIIPNSFHPRLNFHLSGPHLDLPNNYGKSLDLTNSSLEIGQRRIDVSRLSSSARDVLGFQLPTDLSSSSEISNFNGEIGRRDLHNRISNFPNSNSCNRLSEKSVGDGNKKCGGKSKRVRTIFTPEQLERLEAEFERQQYMVGPERLYLAHTLQLTEAQVKVWFQNRRIKWRKQHLEIQQQRLAAIKQQSQRGETEDSDGESRDSNNYSFTTDTNDNGGGGGGGVSGGFFKSIDNELENISGTEYCEDINTFRNENTSENIKNESSNENSIK